MLSHKEERPNLVSFNVWIKSRQKIKTLVDDIARISEVVEMGTL